MLLTFSDHVICFKPLPTPFFPYLPNYQKRPRNVEKYSEDPLLATLNHSARTLATVGNLGRKIENKELTLVHT